VAKLKLRRDTEPRNKRRGKRAVAWNVLLHEAEEREVEATLPIDFRTRPRREKRKVAHPIHVEIT
jgi:hypothetical protein